MPWYITSYITNYVTKYQSVLMGYVTKFYTLEQVTDEEGKVHIITRIVRVVTTPYSFKRKAVVVSTKELERTLKEVVTRRAPRPVMRRYITV